MYREDLSPYSPLFSPGPEGYEIYLAVGWLEKGNPFDIDEPTGELLDALFRRCLEPVNRMRGFHVCDLCDPQPQGMLEVSRDGQTLHVGSAEIRAYGKDGIAYCAPNLIYHYVEAHNYLPPRQFIDALMQA